MSMRQISVLGAGAYGTALAVAFARQSHQRIQLWARDAQLAEQMKTKRENQARLPGVSLPGTVDVTADLVKACQADALVVAIPTKALRSFLEEARAYIQAQTVVLCCKGIEAETGALPSGILTDVLPEAVPAILTGPSFAKDIGQGKPTALCLATQIAQAEPLQSCLSGSVLRLYLSRDLTGAQLGGALKNVIAIGAGITMGRGLGESARAALITRGFAEIVDLAVAKGAEAQTLYGLSGFGDLILTATSAHSRNYAFGLKFGSGQISPKHNITIEGINTAQALMSSEHLNTWPTLHTISRLIAGTLDLDSAVESLMARPLRQE